MINATAAGPNPDPWQEEIRIINLNFQPFEKLLKDICHTGNFKNTKFHFFLANGANLKNFGYSIRCLTLQN